MSGPKVDNRFDADTINSARVSVQKALRGAIGSPVLETNVVIKQESHLVCVKFAKNGAILSSDHLISVEVFHGQGQDCFGQEEKVPCQF
jgi:hypothetical protein